DLQLESLAHGVIALTQASPIYGADRRRLRVAKLRGSAFLGGHHDFRIERGGLRVYPRLVAVDYPRLQTAEKISSGDAGLDALLGGGLDFGTSTLFLGPAGTGKSALATLYGRNAAEQGLKPMFFLFEEGLGTFFTRAKLLGTDLLPYVEGGDAVVQHIDPAEILPGEFAEQVRDAVENRGSRLIIVDSVTGYMNAMLEENFLLPQLHELLSYLRRRGVVIVLVMAQHGLVGASMVAPVDVSYLADTVIVLRHFEANGGLRKAISVIKKRSGVHETAIRQLTIGPGGLRAGEPLTEFRGLLTGVPTFTGDRSHLAESHGGGD
ncbi:MAG TPA: ATPase domain-containing protein, partial [Thermoanaerobaculia bacterium]|nr:ATPase domain-containing protein [Thermoanaerobaculia bacterium]